VGGLIVRELRLNSPTVGPGGPQGSGSKETPTEEKARVHRVRCTPEAQCVFHNTAQDIPPFDKSKIFILSLKLSTFTFAFLVGHHLLFWEADFHKIKVRETLSRSHNDFNTSDNK
jgi:hypothetical protein